MHCWARIFLLTGYWDHKFKNTQTPSVLNFRLAVLILCCWLFFCILMQKITNMMDEQTPCAIFYPFSNYDWDWCWLKGDFEGEPPVWMFRMTTYIYYDEMSVCDVSSSFSAGSSTKSVVMLFCIVIGNVDVIDGIQNTILNLQTYPPKLRRRHMA